MISLQDQDIWWFLVDHVHVKIDITWCNVVKSEELNLMCYSGFQDNWMWTVVVLSKENFHWGCRTLLLLISNDGTGGNLLCDLANHYKYCRDVQFSRSVLHTLLCPVFCLFGRHNGSSRWPSHPGLVSGCATHIIAGYQQWGCCLLPRKRCLGTCHFAIFISISH